LKYGHPFSTQPRSRPEHRPGHLVHVKPEFATRGREVEVRGSKVTCKAHVWQPPFYDPLRLRQQGK
jgi:hypothetical protein